MLAEKRVILTFCFLLNCLQNPHQYSKLMNFFDLHLNRSNELALNFFGGECIHQNHPMLKHFEYLSFLKALF